MIHLLQIEYKKLIPYATFWVIFGLFFAFTPIVFYGAGQIKIEGFPIGEDEEEIKEFKKIKSIAIKRKYFLMASCIIIIGMKNTIDINSTGKYIFQCSGAEKPNCSTNIKGKTFEVTHHISAI